MYFFMDRTSQQNSKSMNLGLFKTSLTFYFSVLWQACLCILRVTTVPLSDHLLCHYDLAITFSCFRACKNRKPNNCLTVMKARDLKTRARIDTRTSCLVSLSPPLSKEQRDGDRQWRGVQVNSGPASACSVLQSGLQSLQHKGFKSW